MLEIERHELILSNLHVLSKLTYNDIQRFLNVSMATIRRDVDKLDKKGLLSKVTGGVICTPNISEEKEIDTKFLENIEEKRIIAQKAAALVSNKDFIFLDAGTTVYHMIDFLKDKNITIVTNGLMHLSKLIAYKIKTILVGGEVKFSTTVLCGAEVINNIEKYRFDKSFIGVNGIDINLGYMTPDINEALVKKKVIEFSTRSYVLADSKKFNKRYNVKFGSLNMCKIITTNKYDISYKDFIYT